jgi:hypothetical protein
VRGARFEQVDFSGMQLDGSDALLRLASRVEAQRHG